MTQGRHFRRSARPGRRVVRPVGPDSRRSARQRLEPADEQYVRAEFVAIGGNPAKLVMNEGRQTGYVEGLDVIQIRGDVFPGKGSSRRSTMSVRAVLAHELAHAHFANGVWFEPGSWQDEFRASVHAARDTPGLVDDERIALLTDALDRLRESGIRLNDVAVTEPSLQEFAEYVRSQLGY